MTTRPEAVVHQLLAGNAKHHAALVAQGEQLVSLRAEIVERLAVLADLARQLEDLASSRLRVRARLVTAESREIFEAQTRRDRAAARGLVGRNPDRSLAWMNLPARIGTGQVVAPVETLPALSVVAEIRHALRHNIARLGRPAKLNALEVEQTLEEDHGYCPWPRHPILTTGVDMDDHGVDHLAVRLARLVDVYTNRKELAALNRDLERLEESAKDVVEGMPGKSAMTIGSETCPHCGRDTLALLSRVPGITALVIRCEGTHQCRCEDDLCACRRRDPRRHEWINSGHATHTWHDLKRAQNKLKERILLETKATDAIAVIRLMHDAVHYQPWSTDCPNPDAHQHSWVEPENVDENPGQLVCMACTPVAVVCTSCHDTDGSAVTWPCPTALACDLDGDLAAAMALTSNDHTTDPE
jgi:hypothetical protein